MSGETMPAEEIISVYQWVFGTRKPYLRDKDGYRIKGQPFPDWERAPVGIHLVVSAIEVGHIFRVDNFGRYGQALEGEKIDILDTLSVYGDISARCSEEEIDRYEAGIFEEHNVPEWHQFGWKIKDAPNFEACFKKWKVGRNNEESTEKDGPPAAQNHLWKLMNKLLKHAIGTEEYESLVKGGSKAQAIQKLVVIGGEYSENEKKALRRNIQEIIGSAKK